MEFQVCARKAEIAHVFKHVLKQIGELGEMLDSSSGALLGSALEVHSRVHPEVHPKTLL